MKKLQEKVEQIANQIKEIDTKENEKLFINEMKKIEVTFHEFIPLQTKIIGHVQRFVPPKQDC